METKTEFPSINEIINSSATQEQTNDPAKAFRNLPVGVYLVNFIRTVKTMNGDATIASLSNDKGEDLGGWWMPNSFAGRLKRFNIDLNRAYYIAKISNFLKDIGGGRQIHEYRIYQK